MLVKAFRIISSYILCFYVLNTNAQGLLFKSEDSLLTQRTSYRVFNSNIPLFKDHFFINFDLSLWDNANLGYVFNLAEKENSYSLSYLFSNGSGNLNFSIDRKCNKITIPLQPSLLKKNNWLKVKIDFDLTSDKVAIQIGNSVFRADKLGFKREMPANLVFGKNQYYTEVPNMAIKNVEVGDGKNNYIFPLNEWSGNNVHDSKGELTGLAENPVWLINESYFWKQVYTISSDAVAGLNFDPLDQNLFIFTRDSLITYEPPLKRATTAAYANKIPVKMVLGKSIFNVRENKCYIYELFDVPKGAPSVASLNMGSRKLKWNTVGKNTRPYQLHHHNAFYDLRQDQFYLFGGYGSYKYHNNFLRYNDSTDRWETAIFTGDTISPRFFAATGPSDREGELFLFGGYGNESGNQIVGGKQYYDFYRIDLKNHSVKKCWHISPVNEVFVPANNLILSPDKKYFYALCYPHELARTELKLYKFSVSDGSYEIVSAPISMASMRIETDVNLFFSPNTDEFICTVQEFTDREHSNIKVYSLTSPPVTTASYLASIQPPKKPQMGLVYYALGSFGILSIYLGWLFFLRKNGDKRIMEPEKEAEPERQAEPAPVIEPEPRIVAKNRNAVYLLGEFNAYDRKGNDITHLFTPKIKQLFVLVLLNSRDGKGISSKKISAKVWPDKDLAKTKNIKGVTVNHLRSIISDMDGIELIFLNDCYSFKIDEPFFCDYCILSDLFNKCKDVDAGSLSDHFNLMARGPLLHDVPESLLEGYRSSYEDQLITFLLPELKRRYDARDFKLALDIAKLILCMDAFNEEALKYQLNSFRKLRGLDYSRRAYDQFTQDYERSLGIAYHVSFDKIIQ